MEGTPAKVDIITTNCQRVKKSVNIYLKLRKEKNRKNTNNRMHIRHKICTKAPSLSRIEKSNRMIDRDLVRLVQIHCIAEYPHAFIWHIWVKQQHHQHQQPKKKKKIIIAELSFFFLFSLSVALFLYSIKLSIRKYTEKNELAAK